MNQLSHLFLEVDFWKRIYPDIDSSHLEDLLNISDTLRRLRWPSLWWFQLTTRTELWKWSMKSISNATNGDAVESKPEQQLNRTQLCWMMKKDEAMLKYILKLLVFLVVFWGVPVTSDVGWDPGVLGEPGQCCFLFLWGALERQNLEHSITQKTSPGNAWNI